MKIAAITLGAILLIGIAIAFFGTSDEMDVTRTLIQGKWVSTQDAKFTREFTAEGKLIDSYDGSAQDTGNWTLFTKEMPPEGFTGTLEEGPIYLAIGFTETPPLYFKVAKIDENSLELVYLDRGNTLSFTRMK